MFSIQAEKLPAAAVAATIAAAAAIATATAAEATTTAAAAESAAATAAAEATTAATGASLAGLGLVDNQRTTAELLTVGAGDGLAGLVVVGHLNKAEPAGTAGLAIDDDRGRGHSAERAEVVPELVFGAAKGEIAYVNPHTVSRILPAQPTLTMKPTRRTGRIRNGPKTTQSDIRTGAIH